MDGVSIGLFAISAFILFFLVFFKIQVVTDKENCHFPISSINNIALRGVCAIEIMIGHIGLSTGNIGLYPFRKAGILPVGLFFMLSAFGLMENLQNNKRYLYSNFNKKRLINIWVPVCLTQIIFGNYISMLGNLPLLVFTVLKRINWYVFEITGFYFLFYVLFKYLNKNIAIICFSCITVIFIIIAFLLKLENPWYGSSLCFPLGLLISCYKQIFEFWAKNYLQNLLVGLLLLFVSMASFFLFGNDSIIGNLIGRNLAAIAFCQVVILLLFHVNLTSKISAQLGKVSYEIFLIHIFVIGQLQQIKEKSDFFLYGGVIIVTIALSFLIYPINGVIKNVLIDFNLSRMDNVDR